MEFKTVVNRTEKTLEATWDGKRYLIPPGESAHPTIIASVVKRQNPIMGTEDPMTGQMEYLIGIKEDGDDITPLKEIPKAHERWDRMKAAGFAPVDIVQGAGGLFQTPSNIASALPVDGGFVKP